LKQEGDKVNKRPKRYKEVFKMEVILAKGRDGSPFLYHLQGYQRGKWIGGNLNITSRRELNKLIRQWFNDIETEIMGTGFWKGVE